MQQLDNQDGTQLDTEIEKYYSHHFTAQAISYKKRVSEQRSVKKVYKIDQEMKGELSHQIAQNNQRLLITPYFWGKVTFFMAMFGAFAKHTIDTRDH